MRVQSAGGAHGIPILISQDCRSVLIYPPSDPVRIADLCFKNNIICSASFQITIGLTVFERAYSVSFGKSCIQNADRMESAGAPWAVLLEDALGTATWLGFWFIFVAEGRDQSISTTYLPSSVTAWNLLMGAY